MANTWNDRITGNEKKYHNHSQQISDIPRLSSYPLLLDYLMSKWILRYWMFCFFFRHPDLDEPKVKKKIHTQQEQERTVRGWRKTKRVTKDLLGLTYVICEKMEWSMCQAVNIYTPYYMHKVYHIKSIINIVTVSKRLFNRITYFIKYEVYFVSYIKYWIRVIWESRIRMRNERN